MEKTAKKQPGFIFSDHFCFLTSQLLRRAAGPRIFGRFLWAVRKRREGILSGKAGLRRIKKPARRTADRCIGASRRHKRCHSEISPDDYFIPRQALKGKNTKRTCPTIISRVMGPWARLSLELFR